MTPQQLAKFFDHSIVKPHATRKEVAAAAATAVRLGTASLTVQPYYIRFAEPLLSGSGVLLGTVVGFPHGNETPEAKEFQARQVLDLGAREIDMVMNLPALKNDDEKAFRRDLELVVRAAEGVHLKVITENGVLTEAEKRLACRWIAESGAHFVKTSTAYSEGGATLSDVRLMRDAVGDRCYVKAAGGVRRLEEVLAFLQAGARRFGSSRTQLFVAELEELSPEGSAAFDAFRPVVSPAVLSA